MSQRFVTLLAAVPVIQSSLFFGANGAAAQDYVITDLGLLPDSHSTEAFSINARRQVVGIADVPLRAFFWENGRLQDMGTLGGSWAVAYGINNSGKVVGLSTLPGDETGHAFIWKGGGLRDLGTLPNGTNSIGSAVNQRGQVVGVAETSDAQVHTFLWHRGTGMLDLGSLSLGGDPNDTRPRAINNRAQIVGSASDDEGRKRAFLWDDGVMTDLGTLGGSQSYAYDINERGEIVGDATTADELESYAVRWTDGQIESLGTLGRWSEARAINNRGDVVGWSEAPDGYYHAVVWREGVLYNLNDLVAPGSGWLLVVANDINNSGDIVGGGYIDDELHAFLLTLDPRPAAAP
ncbi:MAG: hypothetical protein ACYSVY_12300 [Planctomycetota bacterium]|jgi:probable HAF family extracellular repeat protein